MPFYLEDEFFGLKLFPHKTYSQTVEMPFRLTMAALDSNIENVERGSVIARIDDVEYVLCSLTPNACEQHVLNHVFKEGENVTFFVTGKNTAHLTGNFLSVENELDEGYGESLGAYDSHDDDEDDDSEYLGTDEDFSEDLEDTEDEDEEAVQDKKSRKKNRSAKIRELVSEEDSTEETHEKESSLTAKVAHTDSSENSEECSEEGEDIELILDSNSELGSSDESESGDDEVEFLSGSEAEIIDGSDEDDDSEDSDSEEDSDDSNSDSEDISEDEEIDSDLEMADADSADDAPVADVTAKQSQAKNPKNNNANGKRPAAASPSTSNDSKKSKVSTPSVSDKKPQPTPKENKNPQVDEAKNQNKNNKENINKNSTPAKNGATATATPQKSASPTVSSSVRTVQGVKIEDVHPSSNQQANTSAPKASHGKRVGILYKGTLPNGKVFDSNFKSNKPLTFRLGDGSVIKGFDVAVQGMALNSSRLVSIPPHMAYGNKELPGIPRNSTLNFEIKLVKLD